MKPDQAHLSDQDVIALIDGELPRKEMTRAHSHLTTCWTCRARRQEIESAIGTFVRVSRDRFADVVPSPEDSRARLIAQMTQARVSATRAVPQAHWFSGLQLRNRWAALGSFLLLAGIAYLAIAAWHIRSSGRVLAITKPDPGLTPGATVLLSRSELCRESNVKNRAVSASLQRKIFDEYGVYTREASTYELDYLITPALGGADDIHNLWPQSRNTRPWNAAAKDALEDHLRDLVCDGQIDLAVAQHEMATDWIGAYKKYFHTDRPSDRDR